VLFFAGLIMLSAFAVYQAARNPALLFAAVAALAGGVGLVVARRWVMGYGLGHSCARSTSIGSETHLALVIYAALGAALLVAARQAAGFDDPAPDWTSTRIPSYLFGDNADVTVYDKAHVRLILVTWLALWAGLAIILPLWWRYLRASVRRTVQLRMPTALFVALALAGSITLPPFAMDQAHWSVWVGPAVDVGRGMWPFLNESSGYGFLSAGAVAAWMRLFSIGDLSLAVLVSLATLASISLLYVLVRAVTRSAWVGLGCAAILMVGFYDLPRAIAVPNTGALRWQLAALAGLYSFWKSFSHRRAAAVLASIGFGLCVLWDPPFLGFLAIAFLGAHLYRLLISRKTDHLVPLIAAGAGVLCVLAAIALTMRWPGDGLAGIVKRATETSTVYLEGFANRAQTFGWFEPVCLAIGAFVVYSLWRRAWLQRRRLRRTDLFLAGSLFATIPCVVYDMGRTDAAPVFALMWVTLPSAALLLARYYRHARMTRRPIWPVVVPTLLLLSTLNLPYAWAARASDLATHYEKDRLTWAATCAQQVRLGSGCDLATLPTFQHGLTAATQPAFRVDDPSNAALISACQGGQAILSEMDAFVYALGKCDGGDRPGSLVNTIVVPDIQPVLESAMRMQEVAVDHRFGPLHHWREFVDYAEAQLRSRGFVPIPQRTGSQVQSFVSERALAGGVEMLGDTSFQQAAAGSQSHWAVVGQPSFGAGSVRVGEGDSLAQSVPAIPGTRYVYWARVRADESAASARLQLVWTDDSGTVLGYSVDVARATATDQMHAVLGSPPPAAVKGTVTLIAHTGTVSFTDISLQALRDGRPIGWRPNLLADPDFRGLLAGDAANPWVPFGEPSRLGLTTSEPGSAVIGQPEIGYVQTVPVEPGKTYRVGHTASSTDSHTRARLQVVWLDAGHNPVSASTGAVDVGAMPTWHATLIHAPANASYAEVWLTGHDGGRVQFEYAALQELDS
jgi:hypothetical protein